MPDTPLDEVGELRPKTGAASRFVNDLVGPADRHHRRVLEQCGFVDVVAVEPGREASALVRRCAGVVGAPPTADTAVAYEVDVDRRQRADGGLRGRGRSR